MTEASPSEKQSAPAEQINVKQSGGIKIGSSVSEAYGAINGSATVGADLVGREKSAAAEAAELPPIDHTTAPLTGLGVWIWKVEHCEGGSPQRIAERAAAAGLSHVALKIADGNAPYWSDRSVDRVREAAAALKERGLQVWGWHYVRGDDPIGEARTAAQRIAELSLNGYIAHVEGEFKQPGKREAAEDFFKQLRELTAGLPIGLSSFHYPSFHRDMPWDELLKRVDFVIPQVYWEQAHNPGAQLMRSFDEYARLPLARPYFPLGAAYQAGDWRPTPSDLTEFIQTARDLGLNGASFFNWDWIGLGENRELWAVLEKMRWETVTPRAETVEPPARPTLEPPPQTSPLESRIPAPTFERRFIQIIRNDEIERVEDRLGFDNYADAFVQLVLDDRTRPPLTIGISGAWGSGKSFLLHRIYTKLSLLPPEPAPPRRWHQFQAPRQQKRVHVVRFNAWDYNASEAVWPGLVRGILDKLEEGAGPAQRAISRTRRNLQRQIGGVRGKLLPWTALLIAALVVVGYFTRGNWPLLLASLGALGLGGSYALFKSLLDLPMARWLTDLFQEGRSYGSALGYMDEIRKDIQELKTRLLTGTKIVVIIDDLDRCQAAKIVDTLEAIKLLLNFDIFIVFLAVDASVIARAVETRYKEVLAEAGRSGYFYLDKIIQIPFRIPEPDPALVSNYLFGLLSAADAPPTRPLQPHKAKRLSELLSQVAEPMMARLPDDPEEAQTIAKDVLDRVSQIGLYTFRMEKSGRKSHVTVYEFSEVGIVWALLARWWPVSTYLMHEAMRDLPAEIKDSRRPALDWLLNTIEKNSAADIRTQRLREVVDGPLDMFKKAVEVAPRVYFDQLEEVLERWNTPYAITIGFTPAELEAFHNLSAYLYKNPRHIKRVVNTYSLIRMLAARSPQGELVLNAPEIMLKWLIISSQWPFTSQAMLQAFDDEREAMRAGESLAEDDDALTRLYQKAAARITANPDLQKERARLDGDPDILGKFIGDSLRTLSSRQLDLLRAYSINFNPAENSLPQALMLAAPASAAALPPIRNSQST